MNLRSCFPVLLSRAAKGRSNAASVNGSSLAWKERANSRLVAVDGTETVSVTLALSESVASVAGENVPVAPLGRPETENVTGAAD